MCELCRAIFYLYDKDGSGGVDLNELHLALPDAGYSADELNEMFEKYDKDKNGLIDENEFVEMMRDTFK